jgi:glucose-6-phosphate isomerase
MTITLDRLDERSLGAVIALFERAVGIYAELVDVNAYDQPGVEAGKKAAKDVLDMQGRVLRALDAEPRSAADLARAAGVPSAYAWAILRRLAESRSEVRRSGAPDPSGARFRRLSS